MNAQAQVMNLRRQIAGITLQNLSMRAEIPYQRCWRIIQGGATATPAQAAKIDAALDMAEAEQRDARRSLAVLRSSFSAEVQ